MEVKNTMLFLMYLLCLTHTNFAWSAVSDEQEATVNEQLIEIPSNAEDGQLNTEDDHDSNTEDDHDSNGEDDHDSNGEDEHDSNGEDEHNSNREDDHDSNGEDVHELNGEDEHNSNGEDDHDSNGEDEHDSNGENENDSNGEDEHDLNTGEEKLEITEENLNEFLNEEDGSGKDETEDEDDIRDHHRVKRSPEPWGRRSGGSRSSRNSRSSRRSGGWGSRRSGGWGSRRSGSTQSTRRNTRGGWFRSSSRTPKKTTTSSTRRGWGWGSGSSSKKETKVKGFPHDVKKQSELTKLYNSKVVKTQKVSRPLGDLKSFKVGPISHSGVKVTLANGKEYLVHKGDGYGKTSQTVVTDAKHMGSRWESVGKSNNLGTGSKTTIGDMVKAGGKDYSLIGDNCHGASSRILELGGKGNRQRRSAC